MNMTIFSSGAAKRVMAAFISLSATTLCASSIADSPKTEPASSDAARGSTALMTDVRFVSSKTSASLPLWVGLEKGFFKKHRINASFTEVTPANLGKAPQVLGKQFDVALGLQPILISAVSQGLDVVQIAGNEHIGSQNATMLVLARPDANIRSPKDLEGKRLATPVIRGNMHIVTLYWLQKEGVRIESIQSLETAFPNMADLLKSGRVDAVEALEPFTTQLKARGNIIVGNPLLTMGDPTNLSFWMSNGKWARDNPATIARIRDALKDADDWINANRDDAIALLAEKSGLPLAVLKQQNIAHYDPTVATAVPTLEKWITAMQKTLGFSGKVDPNALVLP